MQERPDEVIENHPAAFAAAPAAMDLPMRKDLAPEQLVETPYIPRKDIHKTVGGKITDFFIYDMLGFGANSALSLGVTYYLNPKPWVKNLKAGVQSGITRALGNTESGRVINRVAEIGFMLISGTALTAVMTPLVKNRSRIAYWINRKLGKDADVLPDHMVTVEQPLTVEDRLEQEIKKRVNRHQTSGDLWKARWASVLVPLVGDGMLAGANSRLEKNGHHSLDTLSWRAGQKLHDDVLPKTWVSRMSNFFKGHGASINDMKTNSRENYDLLEKIERTHNHGQLNEGRMMIADQTRLFGKEIGWTLILATFVEKLTSTFQRRRIAREEQKAIAEITREGLVPEGYKVVLEEGVKLEKIGAGTTATGQWAAGAASRQRTQKPEGFAKAVEAGRADVVPLGL